MQVRFIKDLPRPDLGLNIGPFPIKNEQNIPKGVKIIPIFVVLHFGENFMKIQIMIAKLQTTLLCKFSGVFMMGN